MDNTVGNFGSLYLGVNNKAVRNLRNSLSLSEIQKSLIYGTMMGDGCIYGNAGEKQKNYRLQIIHTDKQKELVLWKYKILSNFVLKPPKYLKANNSWRFRTISHPEITEIYSQFYRSNKKMLPMNIEEIMKNKLSLAVWYMDDGCKWLSKGRELGLILNTQNFEVDEIIKIQDVFEKLYRISPRRHRDHGRFRLHIQLKDQCKFLDLIKDNIIDTLRYKLPEYP